MRIVFVVYHDLLTEARSQDTLKALEQIGDVVVVSQNNIPEWSKSQNIIVPYENEKKGLRYVRFLNVAKRVIKQQKPDVVFLHDAINMIPFVKSNCPHSKIICDQSELMLGRRNTNIRMVILNIVDYIYKNQLKKAQLVICANEERAIITQFYYKLREKPYVFENVHRIDDEYNKKELDKKYSEFINDNNRLIVYGGGISKARKTYELMESIISLDKIKLIIAGATPEGLDTFNSLVEKSQAYEKIKYIGFVPRSEWRYLLSIADISFVAFEKNCWNNIYCASGKAYESLFEGTPILCSNNPPLERLCKEKHVGVATDDYVNGINVILSDIQKYKKDAYDYSLSLDYELRINNLVTRIKGAIS